MILRKFDENLCILSREEFEILIRIALGKYNNLEKRVIKLIEFAQLNRLLCCLVSTLLTEHYSHIRNQNTWRKLQIIRDICVIWQRRLVHTLSLLESTGEDVVIIKTIKKPMDITFDIDIVPKTRKTKDAIAEILCRKYGFHLERDEFKPPSKSYLPIDCYWDFSFKGKTLITHEELTSGAYSVRVGNLKLLLPMPEIELLSITSQIIFQNRFITLSEMFNIHHLADNGLDWSQILRLVKRHSWSKEFSYAISIIEYLHKKLYGYSLGSPIKETRFIPSSFPQFLFLIPQTIIDPQMVGIKSSSLKEVKDLLNQLGICFIKKRLPVYGNMIDTGSLKDG